MEKTEETNIKWQLECIFFIFVPISLMLRFGEWETENRSRFLRQGFWKVLGGSAGG